MTEHELKPCPFCGSYDLAVEYDPIVWYVSCDGCCALGPQGITRDEAVESWNKAARDD